MEEKTTRGNAKSDKWLLVINAKEKASQDLIKEELKGFQSLLLNYNLFKYCFTIIHDKDPIKTIHCHCFIELYERLSKSDLLKEIAELLSCDKDQLSLEATNSDYLGVQYLTHKNQPNKEPYEFSDIKTNNQEALDNRYNQVYVDQDAKIKEALYSSDTMTDLLTKISLVEAKKYQSIWKDINNEKKNDLKALYKRLNDKQEYLEELYKLFNRFVTTCENALTQTEKRLINLERFKLQLQELEYIIFND